METERFHERYEKNMERIKRLRLIDDDFMTKCFEGSTECTELLLHIVLEKADLRVVEVHTQHTIKNLQGRSVRLDIFAVDGTGKRYDIEVQRAESGAEEKRARYNSSLMDANILLSGDDPKELPETYTIFITETDVLGRNQGLYHIERVIRETKEAFQDGAHIIYVNGENRDDSPLGKLMHDFFCTDPDDMNYEELANRTRYFKEETEGIQTMCRIWEEVRAEGHAEGRAEGAIENLLENLRAVIKNLNVTADQAMDVLSVPAEKRTYYKEQLSLN